MKNRRLAWLLALLLVMAVFRLAELFRPAPEIEITQPVVTQRRIPAALPAPPALLANAAELPMGDAFEVRRPPPPVAPPPPPPPPSPVRQVAVAPVVAAAVTPPPPAPPPLQIIGTWQDAQGPSVFVAGPAGLRQGRQNDVLFGEYRVQQLTPTQVTVRQLSSNQDFQLNVPQVAATVRR